MPQWTPSKGMDSQTKEDEAKKKLHDETSEDATLAAAKFLKTGVLNDGDSDADEFAQNPNATKKPKA